MAGALSFTPGTNCTPTGRWVKVDTTWDAGYIKKGKFVSSPSDKYFDPEPEEFAKTHRIEATMVY
jgi:transglutaminase/protease-like cytokinesis protein 3